MSGSGDNDSEIACMDSQRRNCRDTTNGGMMGEGNLGFTYYEYDTDLRRDTTSDTVMGRNARGDATGKILSFMALDPAGDDFFTSLTPGVADPSEPVTRTIAPPWDDIRQALAASAAEPPGSVLKREWKTGSYSGFMGLGLGIGYKQQFQIGPIPGALVITASAGVALEAFFTTQFAPDTDEGEGYPCIGDTDCIQAQHGTATFREAAEACYEMGGRLAELSTAGEASAFHDAAVALNRSTNYWAGAQLAYGHRNQSCLGSSYVSSRCAAGMRTSYRWLSNDVEMAESLGSAAVSATPSGGNASTLNTVAPNPAGLVYNPQTRRFQVAAANTRQSYACQLEHVDRADFFKWSLGVNLGVGGGLALAVCSPTDDPGVCVEGSLNFISLSISPTLEQSNQLLWRDGSPWGYRNTMGFQIPWALTILEGSIQAKIQAYIFSVSWPIVSFDGFVLKQGKLLDIPIVAIHEEF